jgi:type II secretory pathway pseudopilin PulG
MRAFTTVECLCVIGILALLAAMAFPALSRAKDRSKTTVCASNLRQLMAATMQYASEYGGDGVYGDASAMGLPLWPHDSFPVIKSFECPAIPNQIFKSSDAIPYFCAFGPDVETSSKPRWADYVDAYKDSAIAWYDLNHNGEDVPILAHMSTKFGLGVSLGGTLVTRRRSGNPFGPDWWHDDFQDRMRK